MDFGHMQKAVHQTSVDSGFWADIGFIGENDLFLANKFVLMHSEISEAYEEFRKIERSDELIEEELADAVIRIMDFAEFCEYDLEKAIAKKNTHNRTRPYKHSKRF